MAGRSEPPKDRREYIRFSVDLPEHPKLVQLDEEIIPLAGWLLATAFAYCGKNLTDGEFVPGVIYRKAYVDPEIGKHLIAAGLWHEPGHDCPKCPQPGDRKLISHDYLEHQRSKEEAQALRSARSDAGAKGAEKRWAAKRAADAAKLPKPRPPMADAMASAIDGATSSAMANAWQVDGNAMAEEEVEEEQLLLHTPDGARMSKPKTLTQHWDEWWAAYPLKKGKGKAREAWDKARGCITIPELLEAVEKFAADPNLPRNRAKIPWPQKWLNEERWNDDPYPVDETAAGRLAPGFQADGSIDVDAVLGRDLWSLPTPPPDRQPGNPGFATWAREQHEAHRLERLEEAKAVLERRRSS